MKKIFMLLIAFSAMTQVEAQRFMISSSDLFFQLEPGETDFKKVTVRNMGDVPQAFQVSMGDFTIDENGDVAYGVANTTPNSCADWIAINKSLFELEPNEVQEVIISMKVPEGNLETRWAAIFVQPAKERLDIVSVDGELAMGIQANTQVAVRIFQSPKSNTQISATINNLKATDNKTALNTYTVDVQNTGATVVNAKLFVVLADLETAEEEAFDPIIVNILPGNKKVVPIRIDEEMKAGKYLLSVILDYGLEDQLEGVQDEIEVK